MNNTTERHIDIPEGPARLAVAGIYDTLNRTLADLQRQAALAQASAATQARLVLSGLGHDVGKAQALRVEKGGACVVVMDEEEKADAEPASPAPKPRVLRGRKGGGAH